MSSQLGYWIAVAVLAALALAVNAAWRRRLKRSGYWVREGDDMAIVIVVIIVLAALALSHVLDLR